MVSLWLQERHTYTPCCDPFLWGKVLFRKILLISLRCKDGNSKRTSPLPSCALSSFPKSSQLGFLHFCSVFTGFHLWHDKSGVRCFVFPVNSSYGHGLPGVKNNFWVLGICSTEHSCWETKIGDAIPILKNLTLDHVMPPQKSVKALNGKSPKCSKIPIRFPQCWPGGMLWICSISGQGRAPQCGQALVCSSGQFCLPGITHIPGMPWLIPTSPKQFGWSFLGFVLEASLVII